MTDAPFTTSSAPPSTTRVLALRGTQLSRLAIAIAAIGTAGCASVSIRGELHAWGPRAGHWDLSADKCRHPDYTEPEDRAYQFVAIGKDSLSVGISVGHERKKVGWHVALENLTSMRTKPIWIEEGDCRVFDVDLHPHGGSDPDSYSGRLELDCTLASGDHVTGKLVFFECGSR
jgi:hypothetical protein